MSNPTETAVVPTQAFELPTNSGSLMLAGGAAFDHIQRVAKMFSSSELVPKEFQGKIANCAIALDMAHRMGANPMAVVQNLYIVHGKPSWSAQFVIACLNQCGKFSPLRFRIIGDGDDKSCTAWAKELESGETLEGPPVSIKLAKAEGWYGKSGSKWQTMPDLMLRYRAATFFGRLYAPDLLMGMQTQEEVMDVGIEKPGKQAAVPLPTAARAKIVEAQADELPNIPPATDPATAMGNRLIDAEIGENEYLAFLVDQQEIDPGEDMFTIPQTVHEKYLKDFNTMVFQIEKRRTKGGVR